MKRFSEREGMHQRGRITLAIWPPGQNEQFSEKDEGAPHRINHWGALTSSLDAILSREDSELGSKLCLADCKGVQA